jgi:hypothetical protein
MKKVFLLRSKNGSFRELCITLFLLKTMGFFQFPPGRVPRLTGRPFQHRFLLMYGDYSRSQSEAV